MRPLLYAAGLTLFPAAAVAYALARSQTPPDNAPARFIRDGTRQTVVCLGASILHGRVSHNVVDLLAARLGDAYQVVNAGVNGDLAYNARLRLPDVIACRPDFVIVLVGTNDIVAAMNATSEARYRRVKRLPVKPTRDWYVENMRGIVDALKKETAAKVAICSLPVLGEALDSPIQRTVAAYGAAVAEIAREEQISYLPIHEDFVATLREGRADGGKPFDGKVLPVFRAIVEHQILGRSFDAIGARNGYALLTDGLHLNRRAAELVANRFEAFVRSTTS